MEEIKGTEVDEAAAGSGEGLQVAPGVQADGSLTPPIKAEPKRQVTLRIPASLYDRIEAQQPKDMDLNPFLLNVLAVGIDAMTGAVNVTQSVPSETAKAAPMQVATENFITRDYAHALVTGAINVLVQRTGDRIDTRDLGEGANFRPGLRTLVKDALLA